MEAAEAASYRSQILGRQAAVRRRIGSLPEGAVRAQTDTVFNGLAVSLRPEDVEALSQDPEVERIIPSVLYHKVLDTALPLVHVPEAWANFRVGGEANAGAGVKIAVLDTGIDINHPMVQDPASLAPAGFPRFTAPTSQCPASDQRFTNSKVIVARNYVSLLDNPDPHCDAEDRDGHGTFVAAIAAGRRATAPNASLAGVAPKAYLGSYKVFGTPGINESATLEAILKAIDDAVKDGMNIINLSLGATADTPPPSDPLAAAVAAATASGVTVVVAAGNEGPATGTVASPGISPAAITVGATTNSRILANPLRISAAVPVPAGLETVGAVPGNGFKISSTVGPAIWEDVASLDATGAACSALPPGSLNGKLGLIRRGGCNFSVKILNAFLAGALAAVLYNNQLSQPPVPMDVGTSTQIAAVMIGNSEGVALKQFLSTAGPGVQGTIEAGRAAISVTPNRIVSFSSAGPSTDFGIKPDLVAPGANIYSAEQQNDPSGVQFNESGFGVASGTSFSSPMVAGAAAVVKQAFPNFTPAQIKSALVNTAAKQVSSVQGDFAGVLSQGNGLLDLDAALGAAATVSPASISFGARPPGSVLLTTTNLSITNGRSAAETFSITATRTVGSDKLTVSASPTSFTVAAGDSQAVTIVARSDDPLTGNVEGFLTIQGQNSQRPLTVPYWGTFLLPSASSEGVVNGASFARGSVAPGSLISIFGTDLVNSAESSLVIPLPASLGGAQVTIGGRAVALLDALPKQLNVQVPVELRGRTSANLEIRLNGIAGAPVTIPLSAAQPGLFSLTQDGKGPGAILHASNHALVTASNPARRGEFLEVYATGLGSVSPVVATGIPGSSNPVSRTDILPTATVGSVAAAVDFSGLAPAFVGLYQVNIVVPPGAAAGQQPLVLTSNGVASNPVTVFIAP